MLTVKESLNINVNLT